jgi:hypothetical protein
MERMTITHPETGREVRVMAWRVEPRAVLEAFASGRYQTARDLGLALLGDDETVCAMRATAHGDSSANNVALRAFEHALDWGLGLRALGWITWAARHGKLPKPFHVAADGSGNVYLIGASGRVYADPVEPERGRRKSKTTR